MGNKTGGKIKMITVLLSIVFLILQAFGINVIQDWNSIYLAIYLEIIVEFIIGMLVICLRVNK